MIEERIRNHLLASPEIFKIASDRIYPIVGRKDASTPCIIYTFRSKTPEDQEMFESVKIMSAICNFTIITQEPVEAIQLATLIRKRLNRSAFEDRNEPDSRVVQYSEFLEERQSFDGNLDLVVAEVDFRLKYREDLE